MDKRCACLHMLNTDVRWCTPWTSTPGNYLNFEWELREQRTTFYLKQIRLQVLLALSSGWNKSSFHIFPFINVFLHLGWISGPPPRPQPHMGKWWPRPTRTERLHDTCRIVRYKGHCRVRTQTFDRLPTTLPGGWIKDIGKECLDQRVFSILILVEVIYKNQELYFFSRNITDLEMAHCTMHRDVQAEKSW